MKLSDYIDKNAQTMQKIEKTYKLYLGDLKKT